jgi:hypothetical protein
MARHTIPDIIERADTRPGTMKAPGGSLALNLVLSLRPSQWTKNLIIFGALGLGQRLMEPGDCSCGSGVCNLLRALRRGLSDQ